MSKEVKLEVMGKPEAKQYAVIYSGEKVGMVWFDDGRARWAGQVKFGGKESKVVYRNRPYGLARQFEGWLKRAAAAPQGGAKPAAKGKAAPAKVRASKPTTPTPKPKRAAPKKRVPVAEASPIPETGAPSEPEVTP